MIAAIAFTDEKTYIVAKFYLTLLKIHNEKNYPVVFITISDKIRL